MATLARYRVQWTGFPGAPGWTSFYFRDTAVPGVWEGAVRTFFDQIKGLLPSNTKIHFPGNFDNINDADGSLVGSFAATAQADVTGTNINSYKAPAGLLLTMDTGTVMDGRRLRGRIFIVPVAGNDENDGTPTSSGTSGIAGPGNNLVTGSGNKWAVWHRPRINASGVVTRAGGSAVITSCSCSDRFTVLRSRRG